MGIDVHVLNFLRFARKRQNFGCVATIGRQGLIVPNDRLKKLLKLERKPNLGSFCEDLLKVHFGATSVESFDNSDYQNATHIADMNKPIKIHDQYDTIIDGGCIEHIYNVPQALKNVSQMCMEAGQILHILPANNFCGHGFWQFSPELFFALYSEANGYRETQVFIADLANERFWYEVRKPQNGQRAHATSPTPLYALVRTRKAGVVTHENIQQSDYVYLWNRKENTSALGSVEISCQTQDQRVHKRISFRIYRSLSEWEMEKHTRPKHHRIRQEPSFVQGRGILAGIIWYNRIHG